MNRSEARRAALAALRRAARTIAEPLDATDERIAARFLYDVDATDRPAVQAALKELSTNGKSFLYPRGAHRHANMTCTHCGRNGVNGFTINWEKYDRRTDATAPAEWLCKNQAACGRRAGTPAPTNSPYTAPPPTGEPNP